MQKRYINILLIASLALISVGNSFFLHAHKNADGEIIIHSHFYNEGNTADAENSGHTHTNEEIKQIYLLSIFASTLILFIVLFYFILTQISKSIRYNLSLYSGNHCLNLFSLRAPPKLFAN